MLVILPKGMDKGACSSQKKKIIFFGKNKHPKKLSGNPAAFFSFAIFEVSLKVMIICHTSSEELLMPVLSILKYFSVA